MPIVAEGAENKGAGRWGRARLLVLLLAGPALLLILLGAAGVAGPLQLGSSLLFSEIMPTPGMPPAVKFARIGSGSEELRGHSYEITGDGIAIGFIVGSWMYTCGWFPGHRAPDDLPVSAPAPTPAPAATYPAPARTGKSKACSR